MVISSDEFCGRYTFGVAGQEFTDDQDIEFRCGGVWEWFFECIESSFPTCSRTQEGIFRGNTPWVSGPFPKSGGTWEVRVEGFNKNECSANCNEGRNRWRCTDKDEAEGMIAFAKWVAGYREGDRDNNPSGTSLYTEPESNCVTSAPSESLAPTVSPAPTVVDAPSCDLTEYPEYIPRTDNVMDRKGLPAGRPQEVSVDCVYTTLPANNAPIEYYEEPLPWLLRSAELPLVAE